MAKQTIAARIDQGALKELIEALEAKGKGYVKKLADEIQMTALDIESDAKANCPVITGRLRASITALVDRDKLSAVVGSNVDYAADVEFGSGKTFEIKVHVKGKRNLQPLTVKGQGAKPYLYPAYFMNVSKMFDRLEKILNA